MNTCQTCHWWYQFSDDPEEEMRYCVFHNSIRGTLGARIDFHGGRRLKTVATFGCTEWRKDERQHDGPG